MTVDVNYYSDVLCIWAFINESRLYEVQEQLGDSLDISMNFLPNFAAVHPKIEKGWAKRGGFEAYADHVEEVASQFEMTIHKDVWRAIQPNSSVIPHSLIKSAQALYGPEQAQILASNIRTAFFMEGQDIGLIDVCLDIALELDMNEDDLLDLIDDGTALSALHEDFSLALEHQISVSPAWVFNEGRQKLIGNVGYRVVEANLKELIENKPLNQLWC